MGENSGEKGRKQRNGMEIRESEKERQTEKLTGTAHQYKRKDQQIPTPPTLYYLNDKGQIISLKE